MGIGDNIRALRKEQGLTQKELGERCGMADSAIRYYESNRGNPTQKTIERIAAALGVHILDLVGIGEDLDKYVCEIDVDSIAESPDITPSQKSELMERIEFLMKSDCRAVYDTLSEQEKVQFWREVANPFEMELEEIFNALNDEGRQKVVDYARDILPTHRRQGAVTDNTTPTPSGKETAPEDE